MHSEDGDPGRVGVATLITILYTLFWIVVGVLVGMGISAWRAV